MNNKGATDVSVAPLFFCLVRYQIAREQVGHLSCLFTWADVGSCGALWYKNEVVLMLLSCLRALFWCDLMRKRFRP